ncbi:hypothetical protein LIS66_17450 [Pseudomonas sp. HN2]|uniref:hypothetical protein n=1 Tax=Pseudomonas sp. HN2 TaxID=2884805 RepID=UPI001D15DA3C|nr:hypothetical protein [Pseudomonas sp. HN2]UEB94166.1 hypothetical protein LIS66_17450 [Pseudomonas sp. HN2]
MNRTLLCAFLAICSGCAKDHVMPAAHLKFMSVEREQSVLYVIRYQSDVDILDLFGLGEREGMISGMLKCALADDQDFSVGKGIRFSSYGLIRSEKTKSESAKFSYFTRAFMSETSSDQSSERHLSVAELNNLLSNKTQIPCKVVITAYGYKPYYSNTMNIPTADLLREINKPE